jgi:hypothetical protein
MAEVAVKKGGTPAGKGRTKERQHRAWQLSVEGFSEREIAPKLEAEGLGRVSHQAVHKMLKVVWAERQQVFMKEAWDQKARQADMLMGLYREAMAAWERSKKGQKGITKKDGAGDGASSGATVTIKESPGDPRFLKQAQECLAEVRKIWGLDAPQKVDMSGTMALGHGSFAEARERQFADWTAVELERLALLQSEVEERKRAEGEEKQAASAGPSDS